MLNHLFCAIIECLLKNCLVICCNKKNMFDHSLAVLTEMLQPTASRAESLTTSFSEHPSFIQKCFGPLARSAYSARALPKPSEGKSLQALLPLLDYFLQGYLGLSIRFVTSSPDFMLCIISTIDYKNRWHFWLPVFSLNPTDLAGVGEMWWIHLCLYRLCTAPF